MAHTGGMIALLPSDADLKRLAVDGGDPPEELHLTLAYLGDDLTELDDATRDQLLAAAQAYAATLTPVTAEVMGHAEFNPDSTEYDPCAVYLVSGEFERDTAHGLGVAALGDAMPPGHPQFIPHVTAGYGLDPAILSYTGPVTFDRLRVAIANHNTDYALGQEAPVIETAEDANGYNANLTADNPGIPVRFPVLAVEGLATSDGRYIEAGALDHRPLPLPILAQTQTPVGGGGHDGAHVIGRLDKMERVPGPTVVSKVSGKPFPEGTFVWVGSGYVDPDSPAANLAMRGYLTGNSVDLSEVEAFIEQDPDNPAPEDDAEGGMKIGGPSGERMRLTKGVIAATTLVPIPAFADAYVELEGLRVVAAAGLTAAATPPWRSAELGDDVCVPCALGEDAPEVAPTGDRMFLVERTMEVLVAGATAGTPAPVAWFRDPGLPGPTPLVVDDDGRVYGHLAQWNVCHTGFAGRCILAPKSRCDYAYFRTGAVLVTGDDDKPMQVGAGKLTVVLDPANDGHAGPTLSAQPAAAHYDNAGTVVADVEVGEDSHGIWVAGALRATATAAQIAALRAAPLSGDWRPIDGRLELVAALGVNTPGFPLPRARVASGQVVSLVAAGIVPRDLPNVEDAAADAVADQVEADLDAKTVQTDAELAARRKAALANIWTLSERHQAVIDDWSFLDAIGDADHLLARNGHVEWFSTEFNWVEKAGGLPKYIKRIAKHLVEKGMDQSRAIATAVNAAKKMCSTGDVNFPGKQQVNPGSKAEACAAVAEWNRKKAK